MSGHISPMDCDLNGLYDYNLRCTWTVAGDFYLIVKLHIHQLDIQVSPNCTLDYLEVNDAPVFDALLYTDQGDLSFWPFLS